MRKEFYKLFLITRRLLLQKKVECIVYAEVINFGFHELRASSRGLAKLPQYT